MKTNPCATQCLDALVSCGLLESYLLTHDHAALRWSPIGLQYRAAVLDLLNVSHRHHNNIRLLRILLAERDLSLTDLPDTDSAILDASAAAAEIAETVIAAVSKPA